MNKSIIILGAVMATLFVSCETDATPQVDANAELQVWTYHHMTI